MIHEFHFVLNKILKDKIVFLSRELNMSISKTVVYILNKMKPVLKKIHYENKEYGNKYSVINANSHLHVYMEENEYRKIKQIQNNLNIFSIAILVRMMLETFMFGIEEFEQEDFNDLLKLYYLMHIKKFENIKIWKKDWVIEQLSYNNNLEVHYKLLFSDNFTLLGFELIT